MRRTCGDPCWYDASDLSNAPTNATDPTGKEIRLYSVNATQGFAEPHGHLIVALYKNGPKGPESVQFFDGTGPRNANEAGIRFFMESVRLAFKGDEISDSIFVYDNHLKGVKGPVLPLIALAAAKGQVAKEVDILKSRLKTQSAGAFAGVVPDLVDVAFANERHKDTANILFRRDLGLDATVPFDTQQFRLNDLVGQRPGLAQIPIYSVIGPNSNTYVRQLLTLSGFDPGAGFVPAGVAPGWNYNNPIFKYGGEAYDSFGNPLHQGDWVDSRGVTRTRDGRRK